jgi:quercetin dioxygenase-like cupin family protein
MAQTESLAAFARRFAAERGNDPLGPVATRVLVDNDRVRVWEMTLAPGEASALHRHDLDYMIVLLEGDRIAAVPGPGSTRAPRAADVTPGRVVYLARGEAEWAVNVGEKPYRELLIELKDPPSR